MVNFAKEQGHPVVWIDSATHAVEYLNEDPELLRDPEMDFLNGLADPVVQTASSTPLGLARGVVLQRLTRTRTISRHSSGALQLSRLSAQQPPRC